jgi:hypothetical protein
MLCESTTFASLKPAAAAELGKQIETLEPSAAVLESKGIVFQLAQYLVTVIKSGYPDLSELKCHGLSQETAVAICTSISKRHTRKAAKMANAKPMAPKPQPKPAPVTPAFKPESQEDVRLSALSLLHDLCLQIETERGDATLLVLAGFSQTAAKELAMYINAARTGAR